MAPLIVAIAVLVVLGLGITVWVFLPAFRGPEAARRDLGTHAGADAIAADQNICALAEAVCEVNTHPAAVLLNALEGTAEMIMFGWNILLEQILQPVP